MAKNFTISRKPASDIKGAWVAQCLEWDLCSMGFPEDVCGAQCACIESMEWLITHKENIGEGIEKKACPADVWEKDWANGEIIILNVDFEGDG